LRGATHHKGVYHAIVYHGPRQVYCVAHGKWCATRGGFTGSHAWLFRKLPCVALQTGCHVRSSTSCHTWPTFTWCHMWSSPIVTTDTTVHAHYYRLLIYIVFTSLCLTPHSEAFQGRRLPATASTDILILILFIVFAIYIVYCFTN